LSINSGTFRGVSTRWVVFQTVCRVGVRETGKKGKHRGTEGTEKREEEGGEKL